MVAPDWLSVSDFTLQLWIAYTVFHPPDIFSQPIAATQEMMDSSRTHPVSLCHKYTPAEDRVTSLLDSEAL